MRVMRGTSLAPWPGMTLEVVRNEAPARAPLIANLVRRHGGPVSAALFDADIEVFRAESMEGVIAFRHGFGCAVSIGDPVCARDRMPALAEAFRSHCRARGWSTVYAVASEPLAAWAANRGYAAIEFARELIVDPRHDPLAGSSAQRLRGKVHRAEREGVVAAEYAPGAARDEALERALTAAARAWLEARHGPQVYLTPIALFAGRGCKRWFYARRGEAIVGVMQLVRMDAYDGYLISQLIATPDAPPGTTELLGVAGLSALGVEGCGYATWGPAPLVDFGHVTGLGSLSEQIGRAVYRAAGHAFHLEARNDYRRKFPIARTAGSYLLFDPPRIGPGIALEVLRAFHASAR